MSRDVDVKKKSSAARHSSADQQQPSTSATQQANKNGSALLEAMALAQGGAQQHRHRAKPPYRRVHEHKPRQEISPLLKYAVFGINFLAAVIGISVFGCGIYLYASYYVPVSEILDFVLNPGIAMIWLGLATATIALLGAIGALRDDMCLLKAFSLTIFLCYIVLVVVAFLVFVLFYSQSNSALSLKGFLNHAVARYHANSNMKEILDYIHNDYQCCGVGTLGFKDWSLNPQFNCSMDNKAVERCGVPFSCCKKPVPRPGAGNVAVEIAHSLQSQPSYTCWQEAQNRSMNDIQQLINVDGCLTYVQRSFERHAVTVGAVIGAIVIPVCISVTLANILAKQIERQKYLLHREAKRDERRKRREKNRFKDPFKEKYKPSGRAPATGDTDLHQIIDETSNKHKSRSPMKKNSQDEQTSKDAKGRPARRRVRSQPNYAEASSSSQEKERTDANKDGEPRRRQRRPREDRIRSTSIPVKSNDDLKIVSEMERARRRPRNDKRMSLAETQNAII